MKEIDCEKLEDLSMLIHDTACIKGWHDAPKSEKKWMMLVVTEVAEAVEADRKGLYGHTDEYKAARSAIKDDKEWRDYYHDNIKPCREAEMADVIIRLLDFAYETWGVDMRFNCYHNDVPCNKDFSDNAWDLVNEKLNSGMLNIATSIYYVYQWADQLGFDIDWHIEQKMKYNEGRSYHHGGKAY